MISFKLLQCTLGMPRISDRMGKGSGFPYPLPFQINFKKFMITAQHGSSVRFLLVLVMSPRFTWFRNHSPNSIFLSLVFLDSVHFLTQILCLSKSTFQWTPFYFASHGLRFVISSLFRFLVVVFPTRLDCHLAVEILGTLWYKEKSFLLTSHSQSLAQRKNAFALSYRNHHVSHKWLNMLAQALISVSIHEHHIAVT